MKDFFETIRFVANKTLDDRFNNYMSGDMIWTSSCHKEATIISYIYIDYETDDIELLIEKEIQSLCSEKEWRDFSNVEQLKKDILKRYKESLKQALKDEEYENAQKLEDKINKIVKQDSQ